MIVVERNDDEKYVVTVSLNELISLVLLIFYINNLVRFMREQYFRKE